MTNVALRSKIQYFDICADEDNEANYVLVSLPGSGVLETSAFITAVEEQICEVLLER